MNGRCLATVDGSTAIPGDVMEKPIWAAGVPLQPKDRGCFWKWISGSHSNGGCFARRAQRLIGDILRASKGEATASIIATFCTTTGRYKFSLSSRTWLGFLRRHFTVSPAGRYRKRGSIERLCVGCQRHGFRTQARVSESADGFFGRMLPEAVQCGRCRAGRALVG